MRNKLFSILMQMQLNNINNRIIIIIRIDLFHRKTRLYIIEILFTIANLAERHWFDSLKFVIFIFNYHFPSGTAINLYQKFVFTTSKAWLPTFDLAGLPLHINIHLHRDTVKYVCTPFLDGFFTT